MEDMSDELTISHKEIDKQKVLHEERAEQQANALKELEVWTSIFHFNLRPIKNL